MYSPPPPPPPPPTPPRSAGYQEPYGAVQMTQRRTAATTLQPPPPSPYYHQADQTYTASTPYVSAASPTPAYSPYAPASPAQPAYMSQAASATPFPAPSPKSSTINISMSLVFLISPLLTMLYTFQETSTLLLPVLLCTCLVLYSLDLANLRNASFMANWIGVLVLSVTNAYDILRSSNSNGLLYPILQLAVESLLFACWAWWWTLQYQWIAKGTRLTMEHLLTNILPLVSASVFTNSVALRIAYHVGKDKAATVAPFLFSICLAAGMLAMKNRSTVPSLVLQAVPPFMHISSFRRRMWSLQYDWSELILVCAVPFLLNFGVTHYKAGKFETTTLKGTFVPMIVSVVASLSLQQAYLIPWCQSVAYLFQGHDVSPTWVFVVYLTLATFAALFAVWVSGKKSAQTNEPLFGEFHEDVIQVSLAFTGLCVGKAIGIPWNLTPLPILAFLGLSVWMTTRMLRYLAVFLFVLHSTGIVLFSYRFAGISSTINLSVPGFQMGLIRFGMTVVLSSLLIGLVMGLAVRTPGGYGTAIMKKMDVTGWLLIAYGLLLTILECTLIKEPVPFRSLTGAEVTEWDEEDNMLYDSWICLFTSLVLDGVTFVMQRYKLITSRSAVVSYSVAVGKAIAVYIDMSGETGDDKSTSSAMLLLRSLVASFMMVVMLAPRVVLEPVHLKTTTGGRYKRSLGPSGRPSDTESKADSVIFMYTIVILPLTLVASVPIVLTPFANAISGHYGGAYYVSPPSLTEVLGFAMSLWGLSSLSMINHYLPDGGGEMWKKLSALTFLMGVCVAIAAPSVPDWVGGSSSASRKSLARNPYATISSAGANLATGDRSRSGGWGLLSASLATLLAITGPLELQERRGPAGKKDNLLLFRMMVFSLMFGCGVAWFITMQCMSEEEFLTVFVTATACMAMAFFGTVAGVLGYFLELENFDEAVQVAKVWLGAFPIFGLIAGVSQFAGEYSHPFRMGGWLSTYLSLCGAVMLGFSIVLRCRHTKNSATRGLGNLSCFSAWLCSVVVLFGRFGVSGLDGGLDKTSIVGIPISVFGTFVTSLILLALDGEVSGPRRNKLQFMGPTKSSASSFGINLQKLGPSNRFAPPVAVCVLVLLCASIYAIFIRGCGLLTIATNHEQVFAKVYGYSRSTGDNDLSSLLKKSAVHDRIMTGSAKLAGSGFWTAGNIFGPLLHLGGLIATLPSLYFLVIGLWTGEKTSHAAMAAPLNLIPLILCKGISALRACALIGLIGGLFQVITRQKHDRTSKMQI